MDEDKLLDAIITLKLAERRLEKVISESEAQERALSRKLIKAMLAKDYPRARSIARSIISLRKKRRHVETMLARMRSIRTDLEVATALNMYSEGLEVAKKIIEEAGDLLDRASMLASSARLDEALSLAAVTSEDTRIEERAVDELLKKAEKLLISRIEEEVPSVDVLDEEVEHEREE